MNTKLALFGGAKAVTLPYPPYPVMGAEEVSGVVRTLLTGQLSQVGHAGVVGEMEDAYARYFGKKYCHSFNSGTAAIHSALFAVGVKPGDEVLTAANTWISGINAVCHAGAIPIFCDSAPDTHHINPAEILRKAGPRTKAVVVTHLWGFPADMDPIIRAARKNNLYIIEDCSHAHGGKYKGKWLGTLGDIGAFSLQGSKSIVAGEGGFLLTDNQAWYQRSMIPGDHGTRLRAELSRRELEPFSHGGGAWTYRIAPICAAIALAQIGKLEALNAARQANFDRLHKRLSKSVKFIQWPTLHRGSVRGWYGTPARYAFDPSKVSRDRFVEACNAEGVRLGGCGYSNFYEIPLFQDPKLFGQLWAVRHENGTEFRPIPKGSLTHHEATRRTSLLMPIPATEAPHLMDQIADGIEKVADAMAKLIKN